MEKGALFEKLAAIEHERWADWQKYMMLACFKEKGIIGENIVLEISQQQWDNWQRQINTPYSDLSEKEKDSDCEQVKRYWDLINTIPRARAIMREALKADECFRLGYLANISMVLYDEVGMDQETRYDLAKKILKLIFD